MRDKQMDGGENSSIDGTLLLLDDEGCDVNIQGKDGDTVLMLATTMIREDDDKFAQLSRRLLANPRIDVNKRNYCEATALHAACRSIYDPNTHLGAQLLLDDGRCDVNAEDNCCETPLMRVVNNITSKDSPGIQNITAVIEAAATRSQQTDRPRR